MPDQPDEYLTTAEVAHEMRVTARTVRRYIAAGLLKAVRRPGSGAYLIRRGDAHAALRGPDPRLN